MSNLRDAKRRVKTITLKDGVEREICFTLNAMAELEDRYGSVEKAFKAMDEGSIKAARCVLWAGLLDSDENLTEKQVGKLIDMQLMNDLMRELSAALGEDLGEDADDNNKDNVTSLPNV